MNNLSLVIKPSIEVTLITLPNLPVMIENTVSTFFLSFRLLERFIAYKFTQNLDKKADNFFDTYPLSPITVVCACMAGRYFLAAVASCSIAYYQTFLFFTAIVTYNKVR